MAETGTEPDQEPLYDGGPDVGPEQAPADIDTSPTYEDGIQDVDQEPGYEIAETDDDDDCGDPGVYEVG